MKKVSLFAAAFAFVGFMTVSCQNDDAGDAIEETVEDADDNMEATSEEVTEEAAH